MPASVFKPVDLATAAASCGAAVEIGHPGQPWVSRAPVFSASGDREFAFGFHNAPMPMATLPDVLLVDAQYPVLGDQLVFRGMNHNAEHQLPGLVGVDGAPTADFAKRTRGIEDAPVRKGRHVLVGGRGANFWHFLYNYVLRLALIAEHPDEELRERAGLVVASDLRDSLRPVFGLLGFDEGRLVEASRFGAERFERLAVGEMPFYVHGGSVFAAETAARFVRRRLPAPERTGRRIYISRRDAAWRRILNEAEVRDVLDRFGFEAIELSALGLDEVVRLMGEADIVVGASGANLGALFFCRPGAKALELTYDPYTVKYYFQGGAAMAGLSHHKLEGEPARTAQGYHQWDFTVPVKRLAKALDQMIAP